MREKKARAIDLDDDEKEGAMGWKEHRRKPPTIELCKVFA